MKSIPDYGDHMTVEDFIEQVEFGTFTNWDGSAYYATVTEMFEGMEAMVDLDSINRHHTHVVWFNK